VLSLDVLSGGRLILGTAAGYLKPEFQALGVDFDERNELLDEALAVMREAWTGGDVEVKGRHFTARGVRMLPTPASRPHPPIWMGGNSRRAMRRAVESCQGWAPFATAGFAQATRTAEISTVADVAGRIDEARAYAREIGRADALDVCFSAYVVSDESLPVAERRAEAEQLEAAGVTWTTVPITGDDRRAVVDRIRRFADDLLVA
jgi:alkanesulfonate monooxygenase SsuD/methylene tetrahydromethanopterin reductase-like flavin-dependent oxidoreductase (luciferase family)